MESIFKECGVVMLEEWRDVVGYEDYYQVSSHGRMRSKDRLVKGRVDYIRKGKLLKTTKNSFGYMKVGLTVDNKTLNKSVHRLSCEAFDPDNIDIEVNHIDGDKSNNHLYNLEWCSKSENMKHARMTGLSTHEFYLHEKGENNPNSKLSKDQVKEIRAKYVPQKYGHRKLAEEYKVSISCIDHILNRRSWK